MLNNNKSWFNLSNNNNLEAFTFTEVIIATFISTFIFAFIFVFLSNISSWIVGMEKKIDIMSSFYDFSYNLNNNRNIYTSGSIIVNNSWTWSDIFLMKDVNWENWMLVWAVNLKDNKLDTDKTTYENRVVWFRKMTSTELSDLDTDINNVYDYVFQDDKIFKDLKVYDFILIWYNSGTIYDLSLIINLDFQNSLIWQSWDDLPRDTFKKFNIDF